jgi:hypothetical protein
MFWFPLPIDYEQNPGESFAFTYEEEKYFFDFLSWDEVLAELKSNGLVWETLCSLEEEAWLAHILPLAVHQFFQFEEDVPRDTCEDEVTQLLTVAFKDFKSDLVATTGAHSPGDPGGQRSDPCQNRAGKFVRSQERGALQELPALQDLPRERLPQEALSVQ